MYGHEFNIIDSNLSNWEGSPTTIGQHEGLTMRQTPVGSIILTLFNESEENDEGKITITSGGSQPKTIDVRAQMNAPHIIVDNYEGNNLNITNISPVKVPIRVVAWGPGFGESRDLPDNGQYVDLPVYTSRTTLTKPQFQQLAMRSLESYNVFAVFIGPTPSVYCVNAPEHSKVPVKGYTEVTSNNQKSVTNNWMGKTLWAANLSAKTAEDAQVSLTNL